MAKNGALTVAKLTSKVGKLNVDTSMNSDWMQGLDRIASAARVDVDDLMTLTASEKIGSPEIESLRKQGNRAVIICTRMLAAVEADNPPVNGAADDTPAETAEQPV